MVYFLKWVPFYPSPYHIYATAVSGSAVRLAELYSQTHSHLVLLELRVSGTHARPRARLCGTALYASQRVVVVDDGVDGVCVKLAFQLGHPGVVKGSARCCVPGRPCVRAGAGAGDGASRARDANVMKSSP